MLKLLSYITMDNSVFSIILHSIQCFILCSCSRTNNSKYRQLWQLFQMINVMISHFFSNGLLSWTPCLSIITVKLGPDKNMMMFPRKGMKKPHSRTLILCSQQLVKGGRENVNNVFFLMTGLGEERSSQGKYSVWTTLCNLHRENFVAQMSLL